MFLKEFLGDFLLASLFCSPSSFSISSLSFSTSCLDIWGRMRCVGGKPVPCLLKGLLFPSGSFFSLRKHIVSCEKGRAQEVFISYSVFGKEMEGMLKITRCSRCCWCC